MDKGQKSELTLVFSIGLLVILSSMPVSATGTQEAASTGQPVEVTWLFDENPQDLNLDTLIANFEAANPTIKIKPLYTPSRIVDKMHTLIAAGTPPDLMRLNDDYVQDYSVRDLLLPLDDYIKKANIKTEGFIPAFWSWPKVRGKHMSWVKGLTAEVVWVNVDAFKQAGVALPPKDRWTFDDFVATAKKLTVTTGTETKRYGGSVSHTFPSNEVTWAANNGGNVYSDDGRKFVLADPPGAEAVQWVADLTLVNHVQPPFSTWGQMNQTDLFAAGSLAMFNGDTRQIPSVARKVGDKFVWAARPIPGKVNFKTGGALDSQVIPKDAKHPAEAFKWLTFLTSEDAYKILGKSGFWLPVKPEWAASYWLPGVAMPQDRDLAIKALDGYLPVPKTTNTEQARNIYWPQIRLVMNGDLKATDALNAVRKDIEALLAEF